VNITPKKLLIDSGIGEEIATMLETAIEAHVDTGRTAKVTFSVVVRTDPDSGKVKAVGRVQSSLPTGDADSITKKLPSVGLLTITNDHPGQQTIGGIDNAELTVDAVIARLNLAIAGSGKTASTYAKIHGLPYLALSKLLASGLVGDTSAYGPIYDHALTLDASAPDEPEAEQDHKSKAAG
jgi:hypothetical protein